MPGPGNVSRLRYRAAGSGGAFTDLDGIGLSAFGVANTPDSYRSALGVEVDRGSVMKEITATSEQYSKFAALETVMTSRAEQELQVEYVGAGTRTYGQVLLTVAPRFAPISDVAGLWIASTAVTGDPTSNAVNWTSLGAVLGQSQPALSVQAPAEGLGRPWFDSAHAEYRALLLEAAWSDLSPFVRTKAQLAIKRPSGAFLVLTGYVFRYHAPENGEDRRAVELVVRGREDSFSDLLRFTDGAGAPTTPGDFVSGFDLRAVGMAYSEASLVSDS